MFDTSTHNETFFKIQKLAYNLASTGMPLKKLLGNKNMETKQCR
jgi:hypothetical protein